MSSPATATDRTSSGEPISRRYVFDTSGPARFFKVFKDALFVGVIAASLALLLTRRQAVQSLHMASGLVPMITLLVFGFASALWLWGPAMAMVGIRTMLFFGVALLGAWMSSAMNSFAAAVMVLMVAQSILVASEFAVGIPLNFCPAAFRAAGSMALPNTLGVFAAAGLAFVDAYGRRDGRFWPLFALALALVYAAGGGAGYVGLAVILCWRLWRGFTACWSAAGAIALASAVMLALLLALPQVTARPDIYDSLLREDGRMGSLIRLGREASPAAFVFGRGLGFGTNASMTLLKDAPQALPRTATGELYSADSTVTVMFIQLGLLGVVAFYAMLFWAMRTDASARGFYLVVTVVSLAINIAEVFPLNLLLGLALAHTIAKRQSCAEPAVAVRPAEPS